MAYYQTGYRSLQVNEDENEDSPHTDEIFQVPREKARWNHIEDLDSFFRRNYRFHQQGGFICIVTSEIYQIVQFIFIMSFSVYVTNCVDFHAVPRHLVQNGTHTKLEFSDLFIPMNVCSKKFSTFTWLFISIAILLLLYYICRTIHRLLCFHETRCFYESALKIPSYELQNVTWHEVQCKLREVQREQLMCIHKQDLSELDIYHRILRQENYMNAMMNKNITVVRLKYPFFGESIYFTPLLRFNTELLLFKSPYSPFKSTWQLKEEYKKNQNRNALAAELSKGFFVLGIVNLFSCFFIFIYQLLTSCVTYAAYVQNEPSFFGTRRWSPYAMLYLRLFNELDHEFKARLSRAYKPAASYMNSFYSHLLNIHLRNISGMCGVFALCLFVWGLFQPEIFEISFILPTLPVMSFICAAGLRMVPKENSVCVPETLMLRVLAELPYLPDHWRGKAHTTNVKVEFSQFFQLKITGIIEHLLSAFIVPYVLIFHLRHRALDIVDFFRCFTVEVSGVGDVCSFALMDISRHGNHEWAGDKIAKVDQTQQAEGGKTELSLLHFTVMNPAWQPPPSSTAFIETFKEQAQTMDISGLAPMPGLDESLKTLQPVGAEHPCALDRGKYSIRTFNQSSFQAELDRPNNLLTHIARGYLNHTEGPLMSINSGLFTSMTSSCNTTASHELMDPVNRTAAELSLTSMHLHELHRRNVLVRRYGQASSSHDQPSHSRNQNEDGRTEREPLLESIHSV